MTFCRPTIIILTKTDCDGGRFEQRRQSYLLIMGTILSHIIPFAIRAAQIKASPLVLNPNRRQDSLQGNARLRGSRAGEECLGTGLFRLSSLLGDRRGQIDVIIYINRHN